MMKRYGREKNKFKSRQNIFQIFPEPYNFKPERFVDSDGKLKRIEEHIPFSVGKRQCMGESLARMELFLLIANLFNQFEVRKKG